MPGQGLLNRHLFIPQGLPDLDKSCILYAPAKINLCLHILGQREDGYHELDSLMQRVTLCDEISLEILDQPGVTVRCPGIKLGAGVDNLAARAARAFLLEIEDDVSGVRIGIEKRIPVAAGLGGGSSDAATVLLGLNRLFGKPLSNDRLAGLGVRLGADVPFFIYERSAWAGGIGELLEPVTGLPRVFYLLVNPRVEVSTAWAFRKWGLTSGGGVAKMRGFPNDIKELVRLLANDLQTVTESGFPVVGQIRQALLNAGAEGAPDCQVAGQPSSGFSQPAKQPGRLPTGWQLSIPGGCRWSSLSVDH